MLREGTAQAAVPSSPHTVAPNPQRWPNLSVPVARPRWCGTVVVGRWVKPGAVTEPIR